MEIISSIILSVLHSILFYKKSIGISMLIFMVLVNGIMLYILKSKDKIKNKKGLIFLIPIMLLSSSYLIFANRTFYVANIFVLMVLEVLILVSITNKKFNIKGIFGVLNDTAAECDKGIALTKEKIKSGTKNKSKIGIEKIAISLLVVFIVASVVIMLLVSADSIFAEVFSGINKIFSKINILNAIIRTRTYFNNLHIFTKLYVSNSKRQRM